MEYSELRNIFSKLRKLKKLIERKKVCKKIEDKIYENTDTTWRNILDSISTIISSAPGDRPNDKPLEFMDELRKEIEYGNIGSEEFSVFEPIFVSIEISWYEIHEAIISFIELHERLSIDIARIISVPFHAKYEVFFKDESKGFFKREGEEEDIKADDYLRPWIFSIHENTGIVEVYGTEQEMLRAFFEPKAVNCIA